MKYNVCILEYLYWLIFHRVFAFNTHLCFLLTELMVKEYLNSPPTQVTQQLKPIDIKLQYSEKANISYKSNTPETPMGLE